MGGVWKIKVIFMIIVLQILYMLYHYLLCQNVDSHESLTGIQKLTYLIKSLEGPTFKDLEGLDIIEANYEKACQILQSRFGKSQQIISGHMQELLNLQSYPSN